MTIAGICELVLETDGVERLQSFYEELGLGPDALSAQLRERGVEVEGPVEHEGGDRSAYFSDPAGNRVEIWDFFRDGDGAEDGVMALAEGDGNGNGA